MAQQMSFKKEKLIIEAEQYKIFFRSVRIYRDYFMFFVLTTLF